MSEVTWSFTPPQAPPREPDDEPADGVTWSFTPPPAAPLPPAPAQPPTVSPPREFPTTTGLVPDARPDLTPSTDTGTDTRQGIIQSIPAALGDVLREGRQLSQGRAFEATPETLPPPVDRTLGGRIAYGVVHGLPTMAGMGLGALAGAGGGAALGGPVGGTVGGILGGAAGGGLMDFAQGLTPAYEDAVRRGLPHDAAVDEAYKVAAAGGALTGATAPLFGLTPFRSVIGNILLHGAVTNPAAGVARREVTPMITGQPAPSVADLVTGYLEDTVSGLGLAGAMHGGQALGRAFAPDLRPILNVGPRPPPEPGPRQIAGPSEVPPEPVPGAGETPVVSQPTTGVPSDVVTPVQPPTGPVPGPVTGPVTVQSPIVPEPPASITVQPVTPPTSVPGQQAGATGIVPGGGAPVVPTPGGEQALSEPTVQAPSAPEPGAKAAAPVQAPVQEPVPAPVQGQAPEPTPVSTTPTTPTTGTGTEPEQPPKTATPGGDISVSPPGPKQEQTAAPPAKRPVTADEMNQIQGAYSKASMALNKAESVRANTPPEKLEALRQRVADARAALDNAEGPPTRPSYIKAPPGAMEAHEAAVKAHEGKVTQRVYQEGTAPVPGPKAAGQLFRMSGVQDQRVVRLTDPRGNAWVGTGHAITRESVLGKAAAQVEKLRTSSTNTLGPDAFARAIQPKPGLQTDPVNWERAVTMPAVKDTPARPVVIGTLPDGTHVTVQKPVFDTLHAAAGPGGTITAANTKSDNRLFARNAQGELMGVGMPLDLKQDLARSYARGIQQEAKAPEVPAPSATNEPVSAPAPGSPPEPAQPVQTTPEPARPAPEPAPGSPAEKLAALDAAKAPDEAYRDALSTGSKTPLRPGETWRDRLVKWVESERRAAEAEGEAKGQGAPELTTIKANEVQAGDTIRTPAGENLRVEAVSGEKRIAVQVEGRTQPLVYPRGMGVTIHARGEAPLETPGPLEARAFGAARGGGRAARGSSDMPKRYTAPKPAQGTPTPYEGRPLTMDDVNYTPGTPRYQAAFHEALAGTGEDPRTAMNKPIVEQVNLLSRAVQQKFGFYRVEIDPKVDPRITRDQLLNMHQNMQGMAHGLDWSLSTLSLDGRLTLRLVPRNFEGKHWLGAYEPGIGRISISGGSNSYAHEHWHAIDEYLSDLLNRHPNKSVLFSHAARKGELDPNNTSHLAFAKVLNEMFYGDGEVALRRLALERTAAHVDAQGNPTQAALDARRQIDALDTGASKLRIPRSEFRTAALGLPSGESYYATAHELLARAGEAYTAWKMNLAGQDTAGVVKSDAHYQTQLLDYMKAAYPNAADRVRIFNAFDELRVELERASVIPLKGPGALPPPDTHTVPSPHQRPPLALRPGWGERIRADFRALGNFFAKDEHEPVFFDPDRPPPPPTYQGGGTPQKRTAIIRASDTLSEVFNSTLGNMERWIRQLPPAARPPMQELLDKVGYQAGSGRWIAEPYEARARRMSRASITRYEDLLREFGFTNRIGKLRMTAGQREELWHTLATGEKSFPLDPHDTTGQGPRRRIEDKVIALAQRVRADVLDPAYDQMKAAGMPIGYAKSGYVPRVMDDPKIRAQGAAFMRDLTEVNKVVINNDLIDTNMSRPERIREWWRGTERQFRESGLFTDKQREAMDQLNRNLNRIAKINEELAAGGAMSPTTFNPRALEAERDMLRGKNQDILDQHEAGIVQGVARVEAENFNARLNRSDANDFVTVGPRGEFLRQRVLPPEADQILRKWYLNDPMRAIPNYLHGVSRKTAYHEVFGTNAANVEELIQKTQAAGMPYETGVKFRAAVETITGKSARDQSGADTMLLNYISGLGALSSLPRAAITSLYEPANTMLNGGTFRQTTRAYLNLFGHAFNTMGAHERTRIARLIGAITSELHGSAMSSRYADYSGTPVLGRIVNAFFELGMSPTQRAIRSSMLGANSRFIRDLLEVTQLPARTNHQKNRLDDAQRLLREYGVRDEQMKEMHDWLKQFDDRGGLPTETALENQRDGMAKLWSVVAVRSVDRFNMDPTAAEKPMGAMKTSWGNAMSQLSNYLYTTMRNTTLPLFERVTHNYRRAFDRAVADGAAAPRLMGILAGARAAGTAAALIAGTSFAVMQAYGPYQYLTNNDAYQRHVQEGDLGEWLFKGAMSQVGIAGPPDIVMNAIEGMRYTATLSNLTEGPYLSQDIRYATDVGFALVDTFSGGSDTNTRIYNGLYALAQLVVKPSIQAALIGVAHRVPAGGPMMGLIRAASMGGTSSTAVRSAIDWMAGERGTTLPGEDEDGLRVRSPRADTADEDAAPLRAPSPYEDTGKENKSSGGAASTAITAGVGALDDVLIPMLGALPAPVRAGAMIGVGALSLGAMALRAHEFAAHGEPPKKQH